ncbi:MFS transporter [Pseudoclavibacter soli]|uniref:MFS transporter n=1 Tax=Pseudoclavibacter soli TaxID=452623 RepID=UPI0004156949|nr:MFS transporter [Pseudoclavibacter soli]
MSSPNSTSGPSANTGRHPSVAGNVIRGSLGNLIEWYDWYIYTAFSVYFSASFFPDSDPTVELLQTMAVFSLGFIMRPIGGWFFGRYADRHGRRSALTLSVVLMAGGSLIITITPDYQTIGVVAPILLLLARVAQGFSVGGEYGTSATYLSEVATPGRRGYYSSFAYVTLISGQLIALLVQIVLQQLISEDAMHTWGWRVPFAIGALGAIAVMLLRRGMSETIAVADAATEKKGEKAGSLALLFKYPKQFFIVLGLTFGGTIAFYTYTTYMQQFMVNTSKIDKPTVTLINFFALLIFVVLQPVYGWISDHIGRKPLLIFFGVGGTLFTVPILSTLAGVHDPFGAFALMLGALVIVGGYTSINAVVKAELFPAKVRALGVGLPYALANALFGGTAPTVALWLKSIGHENWFYWYVTVAIFVSLLVYVWGLTDHRKVATELDRDQAERDAQIRAGA